MNILIIKPSSLGDIIHALPFLNALKTTYPDSMIDWVVSRNLKGILQDNPLINELVIFDKDAWTKVSNLPGTVSEIAALKKRLKLKKYDAVVDLQGLLRSGLITFFTSAKSKIGFAKAREGSRFFYSKKVTTEGSVHAVDRCLDIARAMGSDAIAVQFPLHVTPEALIRVREMLKQNADYILLAPSARWETKKWPVAHFASLASQIKQPCVIAGSRGDLKLADELISLSVNKNIINLCGKTNLAELAALIQGADAVVCNDSGPMHIAAALKVPLVALFGPTDPEKTGPYGWQTNGLIRVMRSEISCSPCLKRRCKKDLACMKNISPVSVLKSLKEIL